MLSTHRRAWRRFLLLTMVVIISTEGNIPPQFNIMSTVIKKEDTPINTTIGQVLATDSDGPNKLIFSIQHGTGSLVRLGTPYGESQTGRFADIILNENLDRDYSPATRQLFFVVTDGVNTVQAKITLIITDVDDEKPLFTGLPYNVTINESQAVGTLIYTVKAVDPDTGRGGQIFYTMKSSDTSCDRLFSLNNYTGEIALKRSLDYEESSFHYCTLFATDGGGLRSEAGIGIVVRDVQDTPPYFEKAVYMAKVAEDALVGISLLTVRAHDGDIANPNLIRMSLYSHTCRHTFRIDPTTGQITLAQAPDREDLELENVNAVCIVNVTATEVHGNITQMGASASSVQVTIEITDVNDNHPTFNTATYKARTARNVPIGTPITLEWPILINVTDKDRGPNGAMQFYLKILGGNNDNIFDVSPQRAYSEAQLFIRVHNATALSAYPDHQIFVGVYAEETETAAKHSSMATMQIKLLPDMHTYCGVTVVA